MRALQGEVAWGKALEGAWGETALLISPVGVRLKRALQRAWAAGPLAGGLAPPRGSLRPLPGPGPASGGGGPLQSPSQQTRSCKGASPPPPQHNHATEESKRSIPKYSQVFLSILYYYAVLLSTLKYSEVFLDIRRYC